VWWSFPLWLKDCSASTSHCAGEMCMTYKQNGDCYVVKILFCNLVCTIYVQNWHILFIEIQQNQWNSLGRLGGNIGSCMYMLRWIKNSPSKCCGNVEGEKFNYLCHWLKHDWSYYCILMWFLASCVILSRTICITSVIMVTFPFTFHT